MNDQNFEEGNFMDFFGVLTMLGGLALFLYGMETMGKGLEKLSGGRLERILEKLTSNPIKAVLLGAGVTAVIQSSSATTVMVVGFVNSGIMKLTQAVGISVTNRTGCFHPVPLILQPNQLYLFFYYLFTYFAALRLSSSLWSHDTRIGQQIAVTMIAAVI